MIDIKKYINNTGELQKNLEIRGYKNPQDATLAIKYYKEYLNLLEKLESSKAEKNIISKEIKLKAQRKESFIEEKNKINDLNEKIKYFESNCNDYKIKYLEILVKFPNILNSEVPEGYEEEDNILVFNSEINKRDFDFPAKPHYKLNVGIDSETGSELSGSRFVLYKNESAKLERALINYMLDTHSLENFNEVVVPSIVKGNILEATGHLPKFKEDLYKIENEDKWLIPTAEVPLTNILRNKILDLELLPIRYTAVSSSFRSESDSGGKDIKGVIRLHEFRKVEMVSITSEENGITELNTLVEQAEKVLKGLKIPYRRLLLCSKETSTASSKTYDLEVWMPGLGTWKEISSVSLCTDYQSRNANIKYKDINGNKKLAYTLNGSGVAIDRCLAAVIENYQTKEGSFVVPEVLKSYYV